MSESAASVLRIRFGERPGADQKRSATVTILAESAATLTPRGDIRVIVPSSRLPAAAIAAEGVCRVWTPTGEVLAEHDYDARAGNWIQLGAPGDKAALQLLTSAGTVVKERAVRVRRGPSAKAKAAAEAAAAKAAAAEKKFECALQKLVVTLPGAGAFRAEGGRLTLVPQSETDRIMLI